MNERIKELAVEAFQPINDIASEGVADYHTFKQPWFQLYNQKFAELIVKECVNVSKDQKKWVEDMESTTFSVQDKSWNKARIQQSQRIIDKIKEHFGVEE